jgi:hypothetical protein
MHMNVVPIQNPPEDAGAKCSNCGASLVADQRYCLTCGQPCSPVRLAFLDVLQAESEARAPGSIAPAPVGYMPPLQQDGAIGWLRRYSGLLALLSVLLTTGLMGLLIGHWTAPSKTPAAQVLTIKGLPVTGAAAAGPLTTTTSSAATPAKAASSRPATEAQEVKEVKEAESPKAKAPPPVKTSSSSLKKLEKLTGKKHQQAIEKLVEGGKPIETGG